MNAAGLAFLLTGVSSELRKTAYFAGIVKSGKVRKDELDGSTALTDALSATVRKATTAKLESFVAQYNDVLTKHHQSFESKKSTDPLGALREAQIMLGYVTTILGKAGLHGIAKK